jgi:membrane protein implicated in regulation of membrane protease activity
MSSSNGPRPRNRAAGWSLVLGLLALAAIPIGAAITGWRSDLRLVHAGFAVPVAAILAIAAILLARRARRRLERTLGRSGERTARVGRILGWLALYGALIGGIAMGVYALEFFVLK